MTTLVLRMARLLGWARSVIQWEYDARGTEYDKRRAWLKETGIVLDEIRQRIGI